MAKHPNPYQPPAARVSGENSDDVVVRPRGLLIAAIVVAVVTAISAGIAPQQLKTFRELFGGFGAVFLITLVALYLPIFRLGAVV